MTGAELIEEHYWLLWWLVLLVAMIISAGMSQSGGDK